MKKLVIITSLSMRFYKSDGWTKELLEQYLLTGSLKTFPEDAAPYWVPNANSSLDIDRLVKDGHVGDLVGKYSYGELQGLSDLEILKERNQ